MERHGYATAELCRKTCAVAGLQLGHVGAQRRLRWAPFQYGSSKNRPDELWHHLLQGFSLQADRPRFLPFSVGLARMDNPADTLRRCPDGSGVGLLLRDARLEGKSPRNRSDPLSAGIEFYVHRRRPLDRRACGQSADRSTHKSHRPYEIQRQQYRRTLLRPIFPGRPFGALRRKQ